MGSNNINTEHPPGYMLDQVFTVVPWYPRCTGSTIHRVYQNPQMLKLKNDVVLHIAHAHPLVNFKSSLDDLLIKCKY